METHPGEGAMKEEKFAHNRKPSHRHVYKNFGISEGNITGRKNRQTNNNNNNKLNRIRA